MFDHQRQSFLMSAAQNHMSGHSDWEVQLIKMSDQLFRRARFYGRLRSLWRRMVGRRNDLSDLNELKPSQVSGIYEEPRVVSVPVDQIRGSEGRSKDFDADFAPLKSHNRERWVGVAVQRLKGEQLPAVELVRAGSVYYVRDGHHRVSVARMLGQKSIDARLIVWELAGQPETQKNARPAAGWRFAGQR